MFPWLFTNTRHFQCFKSLSVWQGMLDAPEQVCFHLLYVSSFWESLSLKLTVHFLYPFYLSLSNLQKLFPSERYETFIYHIICWDFFFLGLSVAFDHVNGVWHINVLFLSFKQVETENPTGFSLKCIYFYLFDEKQSSREREREKRSSIPWFTPQTPATAVPISH